MMVRLVTNHLHLQFLPGCSAIFFPGENMAAALAQYNFGGGVHEVFGKEVAARGLAEAVADAEVQVAAFDADCSDEAHDFEMAVGLGAAGLVGEAEIGLREAAHARHHPTGLDVFLLRKGFDARPEVIAGLEAEGMYFQVVVWHIAFCGGALEAEEG